MSIGVVAKGRTGHCLRLWNVKIRFWLGKTKGIDYGQILSIFKRIFGPARLQVRKRVAQYGKIFWGL